MNNIERIRSYNPGDKFFSVLFGLNKPEELRKGEVQLSQSYIPNMKDQKEFITFNYASVTGDIVSIQASYIDGEIIVHMYDEYQNEVIGEVNKRFNHVPSQGEIFDWAMGVKTLDEEDFIMAPITKNMTADEASKFIQIKSKIYPDLNLLFKNYCKNRKLDNSR